MTPDRLALAAGLALTLAAGLLPAQVQTRGRLIGYTAPTTSPALTPPAVLRQTICTPLERVCATADIGIPAAPHAGGLAYDGTDKAFWYTQGTRLFQISLDGCERLCAAATERTLGGDTLTTGLAYSEARRTLYELESIPGVAAFHALSTVRCPPAPTGSCRFALPTDRHLAGAIAIDQRNGVVYYAASIFDPAAASPQNVILGAQLTSPCDIVCRFPVTSCGRVSLGAIRGMAYDDCDGTLYVTDGSQTTILRRGSLRPCDFTAVGCCDLGPTRAAWFGLDIEAIHADGVGRGCSDASCPRCTPTLSAVGDPVVGNAGFALAIEDGPAGGRAFLGFNVGGCVPQRFPFLCGPFYPNAQNVIFEPVGTLQGTMGQPCSGRALYRIPVPVDYALCGGALCFQGLIFCPSTGIPPGTALTNALQVVVDA